MSLTTRCPVCGTAFRVQREQLAVRGGRVRCGKCAAVFDGVASLVEEGSEKLTLEPSPQLGLFDPSRRGAPQPKGGQEEALLPAFMAEEEPPRRRIWLWALAALVAAAGLAAQTAHRFRAELAAQVPGIRPTLEAACKVLRCQVALPRRPELMSIESSDLQADPREQRNLLPAAAGGQKAAADLKALLAAFEPEKPFAVAPAVDVDRSTEERLRALGY